jgi:hypothetical protein
MVMTEDSCRCLSGNDSVQMVTDVLAEPPASNSEVPPYLKIYIKKRVFLCLIKSHALKA